MARRPACAILFVVLAAAALAGCGDTEAEQRKAFVAFLQTRILDKPGLHVPQLTPDETKSFGPYGAQYAVITDFHKVMNESVSPSLTAAMSQGAISSVSDLVARQSTLRSARETMDRMAKTLADDLAQADAAHAALAQPAELKATFDKVYERLVTTPAATLQRVAPVANQAFSDALDLAAYVDQHKGQVVISGATLQASSISVRDAINAKLQKLQGSQGAVQRAQSAVQTMVYGGQD